MPLEEQLAANTAAVQALTAAIEAQTALIQSGVAKAAGKATAPAAAAEKPAAAAKPAAAKKAAPAAKKAPTEEALREKFGPYLSASTDKAEKRRLTATVKPILEHFGVERVTEIAEENRAEAIGYVETLHAAYEEGGIDAAEAVRLPFMSEEEGEEEEEDGDGVL